jgi:hypothetical protein
MNWYVVKNVFQIIVGDGHHHPQFEERMVLITADNDTSAYAKSLVHGKKGEEQMKNKDGENVWWKFINTSHVHQIDQLEDGTTLCVRSEEPDHLEPYLAWVNQGLHLKIEI